MKYLLTFLLLSACTVTQMVPRPTTKEQVTKNFEILLNASATLLDSQSATFCSGVFYKDFILTAHHCVDDDPIVEVALYKHYTGRGWRNHYTFAVHDSLPEQDLALLSPASNIPKIYTNLTLAQKPSLGERVFLVGSPHGVPYFTSEGRVARPGALLRNKKVTFVTAPAYPGNSGGMVVNDDGEIVGNILI